MQLRQDSVEKKVLELEEKLKLLDEMPSNKLIIEQAQQKDASTGFGGGPSQVQYDSICIVNYILCNQMIIH